MPVTLPVPAYLSPAVRILVRETWGSAGATPNTSATDWTELAAPDVSADPERQSGYELLYFRNRAVPDTGIAAFRFIAGRTALVNVTPAAVADYKRWEVRIQLKDTANPEAAFITFFWGHVDYQVDEPYAGAGEPTSTRVYHCVDGLARLRKWPANRHSYDSDPTTEGVSPREDCYGNPGYNYIVSGDGVVMGNRSPKEYSTTQVYPLPIIVPGFPDGRVFCHVWQGSYTLDASAAALTNTEFQWTDFQAMVHVANASRPFGEPSFDFFLPTAASLLYQMINPWPIAPNDSAWDVLSRIGDRRRGFGAMGVQMFDLVDGSLRVFLVVVSSHRLDVTQEYPAGSGTFLTLPGAVSLGQYFSDWDITGDQRLVDEACQYSDAEMNVMDYVETVGEQIEVATTLSLADCTDSDTDFSAIYDPEKQIGLAPRWTAADVTSFETSDPNTRNAAMWDHIYQEFSLPVDWDFTVGNQLEPGRYINIGYMVDDAGRITRPTEPVTGTQSGFSSPCAIELLGYLPLFRGYDYSGVTPVRFNNTPETQFPSRRGPTMYFRTGDSADDRWFLPVGSFPEGVEGFFELPAAFLPFQPTLEIHPDAVYMKSQFYSDKGLRFYGNPDSVLTPAVLNVRYVAITLSIRSPHRVRFASTAGDLTSPKTVTVPQHPDRPLNPADTDLHDWRYARRKKTFYVPSAHLWLLAPNCIWDLSLTDFTKDGYLARRFGLGALIGPTWMPGIIRDDRIRLLTYHMVVANWYLQPRRRIRIVKKYCGLFDNTVEPFFLDNIGNLVSEGSAKPVETQVTFLDYDHQAGTTEWGTDWYEIMPPV